MKLKDKLGKKKELYFNKQRLRIPIRIYEAMDNGLVGYKVKIGDEWSYLCICFMCGTKFVIQCQPNDAQTQRWSLLGTKCPLCEWPIRDGVPDGAFKVMGEIAKANKFLAENTPRLFGGLFRK